MCVHFVSNKIKNLLRFALHNIKNDRRTLSLRTLSFFYLFHFHGVSHWCWHSAAMKEVDLLFLRRVKYTRKWKQHYAGPSIACIVSNKPFCSDYCVLCVGYRPKHVLFFSSSFRSIYRLCGLVLGFHLCFICSLLWNVKSKKTTTTHVDDESLHSTFNSTLIGSGLPLFISFSWPDNTVWWFFSLSFLNSFGIAEPLFLQLTHFYHTVSEHFIPFFYPFILLISNRWCTILIVVYGFCCAFLLIARHWRRQSILKQTRREWETRDREKAINTLIPHILRWFFSPIPSFLKFIKYTQQAYHQRNFCLVSFFSCSIIFVQFWQCWMSTVLETITSIFPLTFQTDAIFNWLPIPMLCELNYSNHF